MTLDAFPAPLDDAALARTWDAAWGGLACAPRPGLRDELLAAWSGSDRHYHDGRHLRECMALWSAWQGLCERPGEVAIALWFHDAVYVASAPDNELQSAAWARRELRGADAAVARRVDALVMATRHDSAPDSTDAEPLVDIDLAILGSPPARFAQYDRDIRSEYCSVPEGPFRAGRRAVLARFLGRPHLYGSAAARALLEAQARANLRGAIERLSAA